MTHNRIKQAIEYYGFEIIELKRSSYTRMSGKTETCWHYTIKCTQQESAYKFLPPMLNPSFIDWQERIIEGTLSERMAGQLIGAELIESIKNEGDNDSASDN